MNLRKYVGHSPLINIGSTIIVLNEKNEILLNHRTDTNNWGIIGGGMELGESLEEVARRELFEETNLIAKKLKLMNVFSGKELYFKYPNGDETYTVIALYLAEEVAGELKINDDESKELKYFSFDNLPELESRAKYIIDWLKKSNYIIKKLNKI